MGVILFFNFVLFNWKGGYMKKVLLLAIFMLCTCSTRVLAFENNNFNITEEEYLNLANLGFTDNEIRNMDLEEFELNKNLIGKVVSETVTYDCVNKLNLSSSLYGATQLTEYKKMTTTIVSLGNNYRYKVTLEWQKIPSTRSYDIIAIGFDKNVKFSSSLTFKQNYCYSQNNCNSLSKYNLYSSSSGIGASFKLPSDKIISLSSYLYFDVQKNTNSTITTLNAYGDYSHATKVITENNAKRYTINRAIILNNAVLNYYDSIATAQAVWNGNW